VQIFKNTAIEVKKLVEVFIGTLTLFAVLVLRPFIIIRIGRIRSYRIGSFVGDLDRHLSYSSVKKPEANCTFLIMRMCLMPSSRCFGVEKLQFSHEYC
jgi:hypothetical protein